MSHLCYKYDVRLSVTLEDCDHIVQQKVEIGTWHNIVVCLGGYLLIESGRTVNQDSI